MESCYDVALDAREASRHSATMAQSKTLLIMAAGMGSRYGGLKQIDPFGPAGETLLEYSIYDALRAGFDKVVFLIRKDIEKDFREVIGSRVEGVCNVDYAFQELANIPAPHSVPEGREKPWGTGHAILCAKNQIDGMFAAINADDFYGRDAYRVLGNYGDAVDAGAPEYLIVGYVLKETLSPNGTVARAILETDSEGRLRSMTECTGIKEGPSGIENEGQGGAFTLSGDELVSMNMFGFTPTIFDALDERFRAFLQEKGREQKSEFYIPVVVDEMAKEGSATVTVRPTSANWYGVTYKEDGPEVRQAIKELGEAGEYPSPLWRDGAPRPG